MTDQNSVTVQVIPGTHEVLGVRGDRAGVIAYDREFVASLVAGEWHGKAQWLAGFDLDDRDVRHEGAEFVQTLVSELATYGDVWRLPARPGVRVNVDAYHDRDQDVVVLSVYFGGGASVSHYGIESIRELAHTSIESVFDVLDGVGNLLGDLIGRVTSAMTPVETDLALRVVPVDAVRSEADDDPYLDDEEQAALRSATDEEITAAISGAWPQAEERFYAIHDEVQAAAKTAVIAARMER